MKILIKLTSDYIVFKFGDFMLKIFFLNARIWRSVILGPMQVSKRLIAYAHKLD